MNPRILRIALLDNFLPVLVTFLRGYYYSGTYTRNTTYILINFDMHFKYGLMVLSKKKVFVWSIFMLSRYVSKVTSKKSSERLAFIVCLGPSGRAASFFSH